MRASWWNSQSALNGNDDGSQMKIVGILFRVWFVEASQTTTVIARIYKWLIDEQKKTLLISNQLTMVFSTCAIASTPAVNTRRHAHAVEDIRISESRGTVETNIQCRFTDVLRSSD